MRIVCDGCQAKYSIADDKVRAKVFKIRCKKCSNVIVVRGADAAEPAPAPVATEVNDDAIWHLVIDQEQVGPMTAADVHQRFAAGEIDGDTFTWREGLDEWLPLAQLDAFAAIISSTPPVVEPPQPLAAAPTPRAREREDHRDDLFGAQVAAAPAETSAQRLRGERNESSVLFSLGNLAQIANQRPAPVASTPATGSTTAGGEGSGLIDIRSMASAYLGSPGATAGAARTAGAGIGSLDDLPVFGGGGFSEPAVLVPTARPATNTKLLYVMIGAVALLAIAAIVMMVMLLGGTKAAPQVAAVTPPATEPTHVATPPTPVTPPPAEVKTPAITPPATPPPVTAPKTPPARVATPPAQHKEPKEPKTAHAAPPPAEVPAQLKASKTDTCDDISCVVNGDTPCCVARRNNGSAPHDAPKKTETADPNLPPRLVVGQITSTMATVKAKVMSCGDRTPAKGLVKVHLKVNGDGKVSDASVETSPDPALGACVAAAAKRAVFPKTQTGGSFGIPYQF